MRIVETPVYDFTELSDRAKDKARNWFRKRSTMTGGQRLRRLPADLPDPWRHARHNHRPPDGQRTRQKPCIWFSGFWSQGDGACFEGRYAYAPRAPLRIRDYAPRDTELHRIADALQALQKPNFYQLTASFRKTGQYSHAYAMTFDVDRDSPAGQAIAGWHRGRPGHRAARSRQLALSHARART